MRKEAVSVKIIHIISAIISGLFLLFVIFMLGLGGYKIWDSYQTERSAMAATYGKYKPTEEGGVASYNELTEMNPEVIAWLTVYGTNIDYPVVQAGDNWKYLDRDVFGNYSLTGSLYLDRDNSADFSDFNSIIYGHNMTPKVMFGHIKDFRQRDFFETRKYGNLYYGGRHYGIEMFAVVEKNGDDPVFYNPGIADEWTKQAYLDMIKADAIQWRELGAKTSDRLIIMSTCSPMRTNMRDVLIGRITEQTFKDEFADSGREPTIFDVINPGTIWGFISGIPVLAWILMLLPLILLILLMRLRRTRREETEEENEAEEIRE